MKKQFSKRVVIYMAVGLILAIMSIFALQSLVCVSNNTNIAEAKLDSAQLKITGDEYSVEQFTKSVSNNSLAKARAFADMLYLDPETAKDADKLNKIMADLSVNELHIIDENGIITQSTVDAYVGFDMNSGEQSAEFMKIVKDPTLEIVQEPQANSAEGVIIQYAGVARKDAAGFVQIGIMPQYLEEVIASTDTAVALKEIEYGKNGYLFAYDKDGVLVAHKDEALIGKKAEEVGIKTSKVGKLSSKVNGVKGHYTTRSIGDITIGAFLPDSEYFKARTVQSLVMAGIMLVIFSVMELALNKMVERNIISGILNIVKDTEKISAGDFSVVVDERGNDEFSKLSDSINNMVNGITHRMEENKKLVEIQQENIENIKAVCGNLETVSLETLDNAHAIHEGTAEQENTLTELRSIMDKLVSELNSSADSTIEVANDTESTMGTMHAGKQQMEELEKSIDKISSTSKEIEQIIGKINSIAEQTNILSINASIEAARAGEAGKGFAVVAGQVGALAAQSANAAKETGELINSSIHAVEEGKRITARTSEQFTIMAQGIEKTGNSVKNISEMVRQNVSVVDEAVAGLEKIANVIERSVQISENTEQVSQRMTDETGKLLSMV